jgi:hypothetical protein
MTEKEFRCFQIYTGLKLYFDGGKFDWFKYHGKIGINPNVYDKRKDKFFFQKLSKQFTEPELINFFVANFVYDKTSTWIGELTSETSYHTYILWKQNNENLTYNFEKDCKLLCDYFSTSYLDLFIHADGEPKVLKALMNQSIMIESMIILNGCSSFETPKGTFKPFVIISASNCNPLWKDSLYPLFKRSEPFVHYNRDVMIQIINKYFKRGTN